MKPGQKYCALLGGAITVVIVGFVFANSGMKQLKALGIVATILSTPILFLKATTQAKVIRSVKRYSMGIFIFMLIFFATGELALRLWLWNGASFSVHGGPIV